MQFYLTTILFVVFEHINKIFTQGIPMSPCPKIFQYRFDGTEWMGILSVRNTDHGQPLHLKVTLSMRGKPTTNYLGEIELLTRGQYNSDSPVLYKLKFPKTYFPPKILQISTNNQIICFGAADHSLFVTQIQLEHTRKFTFLPDDISTPLTPDFQSAGSSPGVEDTDVLQPTDAAFATKHLPLASREKRPIHPSKDICGRIDSRIRFRVLHVLKLLTAHADKSEREQLDAVGDLLPRLDDDDDITESVGTADENSGPIVTPTFGSSTTADEMPAITRGAWPWLAAIYVNNLTSLSYQCGGTLVSNRVVISSAHCFQLYKKRYTANEVLVFLGRHNLKNWNEEGSLAAPVDDIFIHPSYDEHLHSYDADIAVLILKNAVRLSTFIRPACMWTGSSKSQYIEGELGVVVGWGVRTTNSSTASTVPKIVSAPIVSNDVCFEANDKFRSLSSNRTFCAGIVSAKPTDATQTTANKSSVGRIGATGRTRRLQAGICTGDSGAGLMIFKNKRWMLRGTVSAMLPSSAGGNLSNCSDNQYVIYTDVAKFSDWIFAFII